MTYLARIADRVIGRPLLIHPSKVDVILGVLGGRIGLDVERPEPEANRFVGKPKGPVNARGDMEEWYRVVGGAALVTIEGSMVNRGAWVGASSGLTSYEGIAAQILAAAHDDDVTGIVLDIDSPGGEATGMYGLAEQIRAVRAEKPVIALVNDVAASAGYGIAAQADEIIVSPTSVAGSIGVVLVHADLSKSLEMDGIKPTLIFAGAHKVDGNPFEPLPDAVRDDLQREVGAFYDQFVETVVAGRGDRLDADVVRATEARVFIGAEGVERGLADRVGTLADAIAAATSTSTEFSPARNRASSERRPAMGNQNSAPVAENPGISQQTHDAAVQAATEAGITNGAAAERDRLAAIIGDDKIEGREQAALDLALKSPGMSAEDVVGFVTANLPAKDAPPTTSFEDRKKAAAGEALAGLGIDPQAGAKAPVNINAADIYEARRSVVNG